MCWHNEKIVSTVKPSERLLFKSSFKLSKITNKFQGNFSGNFPLDQRLGAL